MQQNILFFTAQNNTAMLCADIFCLFSLAILLYGGGGNHIPDKPEGALRIL